MTVSYQAESVLTASNTSTEGGMAAIETAIATMAVITCVVHVIIFVFFSGHTLKHFYIKFVALYNFETPVVVQLCYFAQ